MISDIIIAYLINTLINGYSIYNLNICFRISPYSNSKEESNTIIKPELETGSRIEKWMKLSIEINRLKDYLKKKQEASLSITNTEKKYERSLTKVHTQAGASFILRRRISTFRNDGYATQSRN